MRLSLVFFMCGMTTMLFGGLMMFPLFIDVMYHDYASAKSFLACGVFAIFLGASAVFFSKRDWEQKLSPQEMFLTTSSVWLCAALIAALPIFFSPTCKGYADAFFEAMSGLTTTGATVFTGLETLPKGFLLWRAMTQWIGGIGIVVLGISVMPILRIGGLQLFSTENSDRSTKDTPFFMTRIKGIFFIYALISIACAGLLYLAGMSLFDAIAHMMTCVSTGGFSTYDASIAHFNAPAIDWILIFFMTFSSLPFVFTLALVMRKWDKVKYDTQVKTFLLTLLVFILPIAFYLWSVAHFQTIEEALRITAFSIVSVVSTTGYVIEDYTAWGPFFLAFFFFLLGMGGCTGSTAGGIKMFRFNIVFKSLRRHLRMMVMPHAVLVPRYNGLPVTEEITNSVMVFLSAFIITIVLGTLGVAMSGMDLVTSLSGTLSAIANVGPGIGSVIGPDKTFIELPAMAKWILAFVMMLGRLEFMTVTVLLLPTVWKR